MDGMDRRIEDGIGVGSGGGHESGGGGHESGGVVSCGGLGMRGSVFIHGPLGTHSTLSHWGISRIMGCACTVGSANHNIRKCIFPSDCSFEKYSIR